MVKTTTNINFNFWKNKNVLITGHSGFKGSWLTLLLSNLGANVTGISLSPKSKINLYDSLKLNKLCNSFFTNINDINNIGSIILNTKPEIIFHLAAQPLVRLSYDNPLNTYQTNLMGTINVLEVIRELNSLKTAVFITTDKVYENNNNARKSFKEDDKLGGNDPYSASKAAGEIVISSYYNSFFKNKDISISSARAGNIIGGGDWSVDRLIPDAIRAWEANKELKIRMPNAVRPWQHVLDPLFGYLLLAEKTYANNSLSGAYNFGPSSLTNVTVQNLIEKAMVYYQNSYNVITDEKKYESHYLSLDVSKSKLILDYRSNWDIDLTINRTVNWYKKFNEGASAIDLCNDDINRFINN